MSRVLDPALAIAPERTALRGAPPEEALDALANLAGKLLRAPIALVTVANGARHSIEGMTGLEEPWGHLRELAFAFLLCRDVVGGGEAVVVDDALEHPLMRESPGVAELDVAAFIGVPLRTPVGRVVGSVCVLDRVVRMWTDADLGILRGVASTAVTALG